MAKARKIQLAIFDCDGVLVDSEHLANGVFRDCLADVGLDLPIAYLFDNFVGKTLSSCLQLSQELLGRPLPDPYLELLNDFPGVLRHARRAIDDSDSEGVVAEVEFIADSDSLLEINLEARCESVMDPEGLEFFWPGQLLIIGESGAGDYYCIDLNDDDGVVLQFDHQSVEFDEIADSLNEFVEILEEQFCDYPDNLDV